MNKSFNELLSILPNDDQKQKAAVALAAFAKAESERMNKLKQEMNSWRSSAFKDVADHTGFPGFKSPRTERLQKY